MANTGWHLPGSAIANSPVIGASPSVTWVNPDYIKADDTNYARAAPYGSADTYTDYIRAYNFGFSADISASAQIDGIYWRVYGLKTNSIGSPNLYDYDAYAAYGSTLRGTDQSAGAAWGTSFAFHYFGGTSDLCGYAWTAADIRNSSFGVANAMWMDYVSTKVGAYLDIDYVQCIIYFTEPPAAPSGCAAAQDGSDVDVTWTDNSSDEDYFEVSVSVNGGGWSILSAVVAANSTSYTDTTGYSNGDSLQYRVRALKTSGPDSGYSTATAVNYVLDTNVAAAAGSIQLQTHAATLTYDVNVQCATASIQLTTAAAVTGFVASVQAFAAAIEIQAHRATIYAGPPLGWAREQETIQA